MVKIPKLSEINLDTLKKMGNDLVDSVKSGEMMNKVKSGVESVTNTNKKSVVLPEEINNKLEEINAQLAELHAAQRHQQETTNKLYKSLANLSQVLLQGFEQQTGETTTCSTDKPACVNVVEEKPLPEKTAKKKKD